MANENGNGTAAGTTGANGTAKKEYPMFPPGTYRVRPVGTTIGNGQKVIVEFQVLNGELAGRHKSWFGNTNGEGAKYTMNDMKTLGWDGKQNPSAWKATKEVDVVVQHRTWPAKGPYPAKVVDEITRIMPIDGTGNATGLEKLALKPEDRESAGNDILARFAAITGEPAPGGAAPNTFDAGPTKSDDEIPF